MKFSRTLSLLLVVAMLLTMLAGLSMTTSAASDITTPPTGYDDASDVAYKTYNGYTANWGARGEDCTFLSKYATSFYTGSYTYDTLSQKSGGSSQSNAHSSALYSSLKSLMSSKHSYETSYKETRDLYRITDCLKNDTNHISSFYSGTTLNGAWDGGSTWNREHTWPNSKGLGGADENDIMMLRPTSVEENSSRGNTAYGESSGYYDPGVSVRGDCARIVLYVYTRWGNTGKMWGKEGVMENMSVLLKWMEEDPVDTWEMGRNDAVQSITGTRNVFVDYPEYAWLLFSKDIPSNMTTPSGEANGGNACAHTSTREERVEPTCTQSGSVTTICNTCGKSLNTTNLPALGHNYVDGTCTNCGNADIGGGSSEVYYAIFNDANGKVMTTEVSEYTGSSGVTKKQLGSAAASLNSENKLQTSATNVALFKIETKNNVTSFITPEGKYLSCDGTDLTFVNYPSDYTEFVLEEADGGYYIRLANFLYNGNKEQYLEFYRDIFTCYGLVESNAAIYTFSFREVAAPGETPSVEPTTESNAPETEEPTIPAEGYSAIFNAANGKVMTTEISEYTSSSTGITKKQFVSAPASLTADNKLVTEASNVALFKVETVDGITSFITPDGKYLSCDGTNMEIVDSANEYTEFVLEETDGGYFIRLANFLYQETKAQYIEFYRDVFTCFGMGTDTSIYTFSFHELADEDVAPTDPSEAPSENPSEDPSEVPSEEPSENPSEEPTEEPSESEPTVEPSESEPSEEPSETEPTEEPSETEPTEEPSESEPTEDPSEAPSEEPSVNEEEETVEYEGFDDVSEDEWFYDSVVFAVEHKLMNGVGDNKFDPNGNVTRAMLVTILYRNEGEPDIDDLDNPFEDVVEDEWYTDAIIWAADNEIVKGMSDTTFEPNTAITREQIATILYRYAEFNDEDVEDYEDTDISDFSDAEAVSDYAVDAIVWAVGAEIINGMDGNIAPTEPATRAQIAAMLERYLDM